MVKYHGTTFDRTLSYEYNTHVTIIKCKGGLTTLKTTVATSKKQGVLFLLINPLVLPGINCALRSFTLSTLSCERIYTNAV